MSWQKITCIYFFRQCALLQNSQTYTYTHNSLQFPAEMNARGSKTPPIYSFSIIIMGADDLLKKKKKF